jgi:ferredoxin
VDAQNAVESDSESETRMSARVAELSEEEETKEQQLQKSSLKDTVPMSQLEPELNAEERRKCMYCNLTMRVSEQNIIKYCK